MASSRLIAKISRFQIDYTVDLDEAASFSAAATKPRWQGCGTWFPAQGCSRGQGPALFMLFSSDLAANINAEIRNTSNIDSGVMQDDNLVLYQIK